MAGRFIKKLAANGKGGMAAAKVLLIIALFAKKIVKYIRKTFWIFAVIAVFVTVFILVGYYGNAGFISKSADENRAINEKTAKESVDIVNTAEGDLAENKSLSADASDIDAITDAISVSEEETVENLRETEEVKFDKYDWNLILVNKEHPIPDGYTFELATISGSMECDARILTPLNEMFDAAGSEGVNLVVASPYRELSRQEYLFDRKMKGYINKGYSYIEAYKESSSVVTVPGSSEHQIGLSLDIISDNYYKLDENFELTDAGKWLKKNAYKYGFILRYPKGKEEITGIIYEPWHYRYVGLEAAKIIHEKNITLEEFIGEL